MAGRARKPVARVPAFWDTSALVPLCVRQSSTPRAARFYRMFEVVVWWSTPVEITSALARLSRMKQLAPADLIQARQLAQVLADSWMTVQPSDVLRGQAAQLVERYGLRAADALQLAAALEWCENSPQTRIFLTLDLKLRETALLCGFDARKL